MDDKNQQAAAAPKKKSFNILSSFNVGARSGLNMSFNSMMPGLIFAYAIMQILTITNLIDYIEVLFRPIMMLFGLPGASAPALLFGFVSTGGGLGIVANLFVSGQLNPSQVAMLLAGIMCLGASMQYIGRILSLVEIKSKYFPIFIGLNLLASLLGMTIVRILV